MKSILSWSAMAMLALAADDPRKAVRDLAPKSEVRVWLAGESKPLEGSLDELTAESLVLITKKDQRSLDRQQIERIDSRPGAVRVKRESSSTAPAAVPPAAEPPNLYSRRANVPIGSVSSGVTVTGKWSWTTIYRRGASQ